MSQFEKHKIEQSIKDFKKNIENAHTEISFLEKKKNQDEMATLFRTIFW
ncbi:hypothetical protein [Spiroplasma endosymbiont of Notiophilus biguttatus]